MLKHNLILIYRNFLRNKSTFFINLIGLSTGISCIILIYLWINSELRVDKFHEKDKVLFQVMQNSADASGVQTIEFTPGLLAKELAADFPEIEFSTSVIPPHFFPQKGILSIGNDNFIKVSEQYVGKDYFNIFSFELIQGKKEEVLSDKNFIVLSEDVAVKLFGSKENVVGKMVNWNRPGFNGIYEVSGVFRNLPDNSSEKFDVLFSYEMFLEKFPPLQSWGNNAPSTYFTVNGAADVDQLRAKISGYLKSKFKEATGTLFIRRYSDKYLYGKYENGIQSGGRIEYVKLFSIIAAFILAIACINFMNLSTAQASRRIKEVGVKKTIGVPRKTLVFQYLGESMLMTVISLCIAFLIAILLLPKFNLITGKHLQFHFDAMFFLAMLGVTIITGVVSGSYPALYLSGFRPVTVLKGRVNASTGELWTRKTLVVFQFIISVVLIISVMIVYNQMEYVQHKNLGYRRDNIIHFMKEGKLTDDLETFLVEIRNIPGVVAASNMGYDISHPNGTMSGLRWEGSKPEDEKILFANLEVGYNVIELFNIEMKEGRAFSKDFGNEETKIIFNEAAIESMGLKDPVGKIVTLWGQQKQIIGVAKNFHFESLYESIKPCFFQFSPNGNNIVVQIKSGMEVETIGSIGKFYHNYNNALAFEFKFLDDEYQELYTSEQRIAVLSKYFATIAIIISCLGLFGLASFTAERRLKEIGIRKVFGSSQFNIIYLLSSDFTKIVLTSLLISLPLSYFLAGNWLDKFAYRITLEWWFFAVGGFAAILIAWFTIGLQIVRTAKINPVDCLKSE